MEEYKALKYTISDGIETIVLNRPEVRNALNSTFFKEMDIIISSIKNNRAVRVLIITGEGKAFAAGADIAEMQNLNSEQGREWSMTGQRTFKSLGELDIPVIAAINGYALGGGLELAMGCDFRIASSNAKFGQPEVNLGLIPGYAATQRLSRLTNLSNALFMICSGEMLTADEALRIGLIQKVVEPEHLMEFTLDLAKKIASKGPVSVRKAKEAIRKGFLMNMDDACMLESKMFGSLFGTPEASEGMAAFLEKRPPKFST
jgi:enoyl-CoA hydratase